MQDRLKDTLSFLEEVNASNKKEEGFGHEKVFYHLIKNVGLSYGDIVSVPIPFLLGLVRCFDEELKAQKRAMKK